MHLVDLRDLGEVVDDPVHDRPAADRQELLRPGVGQRTEAGRVARREDQRLHAATAPLSDSTYGARWTPRSVTIAAINAAGVTSNAGFRAANRAVTSAGSRSSIGIDAPSGVPEVERRARRDDVHRQIVVAREHGERVRPDLVRRVAVRGDAVGAGDHAVDFSGGHQRSCGRVGDHRVRDRRCLELPRRQARALKQRPRLVDPDVREQSALERGDERANGGAITARREPARVAVRERARPGREQVGRVRRHLPAPLDLGDVDRARVLPRRIAAHLVERPSEVDGRRPRGAQDRVGGGQILTARRCEREAVRRGDADRRRTADDHRPDRVGDLGGRAAPHLDDVFRGEGAGRAGRRRPARGARSVQVRASRRRASLRCPRPTTRGTSPAPP